MGKINRSYVCKLENALRDVRKAVRSGTPRSFLIIDLERILNSALGEESWEQNAN